MCASTSPDAAAAQPRDPALRFKIFFWGAHILLLGSMTVGMIIYVAHTRPKPLPVLAHVPQFTLTERSGRAVSSEELRGKVWVADFIFTNCAGPCPMMTRFMADLQAALPPRDDLRLVSFSVDPARDTPQALTDYAQKFGAHPDHWLFLTGQKEEIYRLAQSGFLVTVMDTPPELRESGQEPILHSTVFVLVDRQGRVRGHYDTETENGLQKLYRDLETLLRERAKS